jgi:hypothetical protein
MTLLWNSDVSPKAKLANNLRPAGYSIARRQYSQNNRKAVIQLN